MPAVKRAVSLQKELAERADKAARAMKVSRSRFYALALEDYLRQQETRELIRQINAAHANGLDPEDKTRIELMRKKQRRLVEGQW